MDDEDLNDLKQSRDLVDTTQQLHLPLLDNNDNTNNILLLPPHSSSIGAKILQKQGWRPGQGIGPRISLARRRAQDALAYDPLSGTRLSSTLAIPADDPEAEKHTYPPRDFPVLSVRRKDNSHGLGYVPEPSLHSTSDSAPKLAGMKIFLFSCTFLTNYPLQVVLVLEHSTMQMKTT